MHKILNGLRYGNAKTKTYILLILGLLVFGTVSVVMCIIYKAPLWAMSAVFCFLLAIILMQSVSFKNTGKLTSKEKSKSSQQSIHSRQTGNKDDHDGSDCDEEESQDKNQDGQKKSDEEKDQEEQVLTPEEIIESYSEKDVKQILVKYKVKREHYPIMIDSYNSKKIKQCPAYAWVEKDELKLLLFEKEPRKIGIPLNEANSITYERNAEVNIVSDYQAFEKPSFLKLVFSSYLPTTFEISQRQYRKNIYVIGKDLKVTNTSAKTMLTMLSLNLSVENLIRDPKYHNPYFESAYALNLMLKDTVLSVNEYKNRIKDLLQKLTDAKISKEDFLAYMNQLVQGRLITREYAEFYIDRRK